MSMISSLEKASPCVLRLGLAVVIVWFGASQLHNGSAWTSIVPAWAVNLSGLSAQTIVLMNGWFEIVAGTLLAVGVLTRWVALILAIHLFVIAIDMGITPVGMRDIGLSVALVSVALAGSDTHCFEFPHKVV